MLILKFFIYLPCMNTQQWTTATFKGTPVISSSDHPKTGIYQGSANVCERDHNSDLIRLLQQSQETHYCNQSMKEIVPDLNIFLFSIMIFDLISKSALIQFSLLHVSYLYSLTGLRFYIFCSLRQLRLRDRHCHGWVHYIDTTKIRS